MSETGSVQKLAGETPPAYTHPKAKDEHRWLQKLVGEWTYETDLGPAHKGGKATGTERGRAIGDFWVQLESTGQMPGSGAEATWITTLGFDMVKRRFTGTWIGSMMPHQWLYDGELDTTSDRLTLTSEGPSMSDESQLALYRDVIEFQGDEQRTLTASMQQPDGAWQPFMTVSYRRRRRS